MKKSLKILVLAILFSSCSALTGEEIARISIKEISTENNLKIEQTTLDLKKGEEIAIWSEMDMKYEGDLGLRFRIEILKNDSTYKQLELDPMEKNITIGETKTSIMGKTNWSFSGKNGELLIDEDAKYTINAILVSSDNPSLVLTKSDLVFKK